MKTELKISLVWLGFILISLFTLTNLSPFTIDLLLGSYNTDSSPLFGLRRLLTIFAISFITFLPFYLGVYYSLKSPIRKKLFTGFIFISIIFIGYFLIGFPSLFIFVKGFASVGPLAASFLVSIYFLITYFIFAIFHLITLFYYLKNNSLLNSITKYYFKRLLVFFIIINILLFTHLYYNSITQRLAVKQNNPEICNKLKSTFIIFPLSRDYSESSYKYPEDCILKVAALNNNSNACSILPTKQTSYTSDYHALLCNYEIKNCEELRNVGKKWNLRKASFYVACKKDIPVHYVNRYDDQIDECLDKDPSEQDECLDSFVNKKTK